MIEEGKVEGLPAPGVRQRGTLSDASIELRVVFVVVQDATEACLPGFASEIR